MKIFAIVVTYNGMRWYDRCFGSLRNSDMPVETIVIDNASTDETVSYIKENFPEVCLIESKENLGFAKANNIGIRKALDNEADYVFLLNQDAWVEKDTLTKLVQTFEDNENVGIASPVHLNGEYTGLDWGFVWGLPQNAISDAFLGKLKKYYISSAVSAAAWLVSADCVKKVGGFDTLLFKHYGEDNNYCQRLIYHKYNLLINTTCSICHDRTHRQGKDEVEYRDKLLKKYDVYTKVKYADVNNSFNFSHLRWCQIKFLIKSILKLSFKNIRVFRQNMKNLNLIEQSRTLNIKGGQIWL